jgi:hypothetical protein
MRNLILMTAALTAVSLFSCETPNDRKTEGNTSAQEQDTTDIIHFNIAIVPDLSNRMDQALYPKPISDYAIAKSVITNLYPKILTHRRSENQADKVAVGFINKANVRQYDINTSALKIDFSKFENQLSRIHYVKGRTERTFAIDTSNFLKEFKRITSRAARGPAGADVWSFFQNGIDGILIQKDERITPYNNKIYRNKFRNILILITDGYVEAGLYRDGGCSDEANQCYYLSKRRVDEFRNAFQRSGEPDMKTFFAKNNYGIVRVSNPNLGEVEVLALEFYDRSLNRNGTPTVYPSDWEILKLFWDDWLQKSGVKKYELRQIATSKQDVEEAILRFLRVN